MVLPLSEAVHILPPVALTLRGEITVKPAGTSTVADFIVWLAVVMRPVQARLPLQFSIVMECVLSLPAATDVGVVVELKYLTV
jgi:hypothetical protein